jgi:TetR/AcrR family fatty acid metabolism transcriptional regulator
LREAGATVTLLNHYSFLTVTTPQVGKSNPSSGSGSSRGKRVPRSSDKHQRILDAAIEVIAENGYFQSRVTDIAARAGVADGTIYLYFKNKEQVLMAAIDSAFAAFLKRARAELSHTREPGERLRRLAHLHLETLGANRSLAIVFQTELRQSAKFLAQFSHHQLVEYFNLIRAEVREGQRAGVFRRELSDKIVANCFFGALDEMVTSWMLSEHDYPLAGAADAVVDVILKGMETRAQA